MTHRHIFNMVCTYFNRESNRMNMLKTTLSRINMDDVQGQFVSLGIAVKNVAGDIRPISDIYADLAVKWNTLTREQKLQTSVLAAGRWHVTRFMALMDGWDTATKATITSQQSLNSSLEENYKHQRSLESQINRLKTATQEWAVLLGKSGVSDAMSTGIGVLTKYIHGLSELTTTYGATTSAIGVLMIALVALRTEFISTFRDLKIRNELQMVNAELATQSKTLTLLKLSWASLGATIVTVGRTIGATFLALATNPMTWVIALATTIPLVLGHMKQVREEQDQLNKTYQASIEKLNEIKSITDEIGTPTLQNINDLEAQIKMMDKFIYKLKEAQDAKKQVTTNDYTGEQIITIPKLKIEDLSKEDRDYLANFGIDVNNVKYVDEALALLNGRISENVDLIKEAKVNSTEYQEKLIKEAQSQVQLEENTIKLVEEYKKLKNAKSLNIEETKRLNEVYLILSQQFPDQVKGSELIVGAIEEEARKRYNLANANVDASKTQLTENRKRVADQYATMMKMIALYQEEAKVLQALVQARISSGSILSFADFKMTEGVANTEEKVKDLRINAQQLAETLNNIDSVLGSKPSMPSGGGSKDSKSSSSKEISEKIYTTDKYKESLAQLDNQISLSQSQQTKMKESSVEYRKEMELQISLLKQKQELTRNEANRLRTETAELEKQLSAMGDFNSLSNENKKIFNELTKAIHDNKSSILQLSEAWWDFEKSIDAINTELKNTLEQLADEVIDTYKEIYETQKDVALDAIDEQIKAEKKRHDKAIENIEDEQDRFEEYVNSKIKALDKEKSENDYNRDLTKAQKERQEILNQINLLSMDDSWEAKSKLSELNKELAEKDMEIAEMQSDHSYDLRKENLEDQLDIYDKDVEAKKDAEDEKYEAEIDRLEDVKKETEKFYNELINDEERFTRIRNEILEGHIDTVKSDFASFGVFLNANMTAIGNTLTTNLINKLKTIQQEIKNTSDELSNLNSDNGNKSDMTWEEKLDYYGTGTPQAIQDANKEIQRAKDKYWDYIEAGDANKALGANTWANQIREAIGLPKEITSLEVIQSIINAVKNGTFKIPKHHDGGVVGNSPSRLANLVNKLFNLKNGETLTKSLIGEVQVPPSNFPNIISNVQNMISSIMPKQQVATSAGNIIMNINIDNVNANNRNDVNKMADTIFSKTVNYLKSKGSI